MRYAAIILFGLSLFCHPQNVEAQRVEGYYKPPIVIPIALKVDSNGSVDMEVTGEFVTPIGTFGVGAGSGATRSDDATYFVVRHNKKEQIYRFGTDGKLKIGTDGRHEFQLSTHPSYRNAFLIEIASYSGTINLEFVPGDPANIASLGNASYSKVVLAADGTITYSGKTYDVDDWDGFVFALDPDKERAYVFDKSLENGIGLYPIKRGSGEYLKVLWFEQCVRTMKRGSTKIVKPKKTFGDDKCLTVFDDGSVEVIHSCKHFFVISHTCWHYTFIPGPTIKNIRHKTEGFDGLAIKYKHHRGSETEKVWEFAAAYLGEVKDVKSLVAYHRGKF